MNTAIKNFISYMGIKKPGRVFDRVIVNRNLTICQYYPATLDDHYYFLLLQAVAS
jgi:hypothetical protein